MQLFDFKFDKGSVWLVGAGPGDPGLLTLLAYKSIKKADVIFYDALLDDHILSIAKPKAELVFVGKRGNKKSINQLEINKLLINEAKKNKRVLRLKGGDPFIFGRGGEEALSLKLNKIPYKIVPGTTAGIAGLAYAGIPATHRDFNTSITFISAYGAGGEKPETINWNSFSKTSQLIVVYMGLERINWVCSELIKQGRDKYENIAIISNATKRNQKVLISNLKDCSINFDKSIIDSPALLVVGKNVLLSPILNWYVKDKENINFFKERKNNYEYYNSI
ncbi:MAG: Uroporphyrinogen-III C-methyltransferase [Alphaproteobacteria bacterium MarineAlpha6_Bin6]|nr:uroporphyrinogen-III C-methyltransferase [Pelagibacteraceae bacterium]PPR32126.1 MAG: Uroporphyrinogen-III C-methyltransferase [Alphaproteobacteria bacterium MarineAlpha6_Bin6]PPR32785.1 MAG: Uroporphyrinogen-III C-methyltransferase [Alphaproteobacteria bacterium MarineAlpha6_Bin5]|tara:strand:- start:644 stop:1477 length:834 start_codon:yes stop_codon:yes gene_type:complete